MPILVSDTLVLTALKRALLLEDMFQLPFEFVVPDLLYTRELAGEFGDQLVQLGLRVEVLTPNEVTCATTVRRNNAHLSVPDAFAFALAATRRWALLAGEVSLRELAIADQLELHRAPWLFDQLADHTDVGFEQLRAGLSVVAGYRHCDLPANEVRRHLARYAGPLRRG
ncbi:hypothetical protein AUC70_07780 [Methyloceanibacter stevinii]|uniref:PIN domain-containing protein n=1 Tax=Methyloceanibacter stevinii TaxID=1774970 RepID=A0A1E3VMJ3_9HYPH|nr:hypothetical protein AUC70_07780 [Methyloceanibacter stevinii]